MSENTDNFYAVILAGGGGTRLWPRSRKKTPKHLLKLFDDESLLQIAYKRIADVLPADHIFVITFKDHAQEVMEELPNIPRENFIIEPIAKNTALAMGVSSAYIKRVNPSASIIFLAADHIIANIPRFQMNALAALRVASASPNIVSIGIKPNFPHTGLGYIKIGDELNAESKIAKKGFVFQVDSFKEKPNLVTAQAFLASGEYLWNANLYTWSVNTIFEAFEENSQKISQAIKAVADADKVTETLLEKIYTEVGETDSIDYEISEKVDNIVVIPGDFGWSDVGDWKVVYDLKDKDSDKNVVIGDKENVINVGSGNSLVEVNGKLIALVGLENVVVIDTEDAILICNKDKTQDVKKVVEKLKQDQKTKFL